MPFTKVAYEPGGFLPASLRDVQMARHLADIVEVASSVLTLRWRCLGHLPSVRPLHAKENSACLRFPIGLLPGPKGREYRLIKPDLQRTKRHYPSLHPGHFVARASVFEIARFTPGASTTRDTNLGVARLLPRDVSRSMLKAAAAKGADTANGVMVA